MFLQFKVTERVQVNAGLGTLGVQLFGYKWDLINVGLVTPNIDMWGPYSICVDLPTAEPTASPTKKVAPSPASVAYVVTVPVTQVLTG